MNEDNPSSRRPERRSGGSLGSYIQQIENELGPRTPRPPVPPAPRAEDRPGSLLRRIENAQSETPPPRPAEDRRQQRGRRRHEQQPPPPADDRPDWLKSLHDAAEEPLPRPEEAVPAPHEEEPIVIPEWLAGPQRVEPAVQPPAERPASLPVDEEEANEVIELPEPGSAADASQRPQRTIREMIQDEVDRAREQASHPTEDQPAPADETPPEPDLGAARRRVAELKDKLHARDRSNEEQLYEQRAMETGTEEERAQKVPDQLKKLEDSLDIWEQYVSNQEDVEHRWSQLQDLVEKAKTAMETFNSTTGATKYHAEETIHRMEKYERDRQAALAHQEEQRGKMTEEQFNKWKKLLEDIPEETKQAAQRTVEEARKTLNTLGAAEEGLLLAQNLALKQLEEYERSVVPPEIRGTTVVRPPETRQDIDRLYLAVVEPIKAQALDNREQIRRRLAEEKDPNLRLAREATRQTEEAIRQREAARADARRLRDQAANGQLPEQIAARQREADLQRQMEHLRHQAAEDRVNRGETEDEALQRVDEEQPELEQDLTPEPVEPLSRWAAIQTLARQHIHDWWYQIDPRDKSRIFKAAWTVGLVESAALSLSGIPFGRIIATTLQLAAARGIRLGLKWDYERKVLRAREDLAGADREQRVAELTERYQRGDGYIQQALLGLSAGMTVGGIGAAAVSAVQFGVENLHHFYSPPPVEGTGPAVPSVAVEKPPIPPSGLTDGIHHELPPAAPTALNPEVTINHGSFWKSWHIDTAAAPDWSDLNNSVTRTDVVKDMVVKLARHNFQASQGTFGMELGNVRPNQAIDIAKILTPEQLELVKKAAGTKSYGEYLSAIRPAYRVLLSK